MKSPYTLTFIALLFAAALFTTGCYESSTDTAAVEAPEFEKTEAANSAEPAEFVTDAVTPTPVVEVSRDELIEIVGYLTAQGGGVASLQLDQASIATLAEGLQKSLNGEINIVKFPKEEVESAFGQAQARA